MAFLDNPAIILAHIRQSHVTSDDTGMCEMVLIDHDVDQEKGQLASMLPGSGGGSLGSDSLSEGGSLGGGGGGGGGGGDNPGCDLSQSMDITSSWDFGIRRRSNTAQRLERLRKERQNQIKCKNIQWKERSSSQSVDDLGSLFEKRDFRDRQRSSGTKSTLSLRLEQCPQQLNNPFNEYSKFDGKSVSVMGNQAVSTLKLKATMEVMKDGVTCTASNTHGTDTKAFAVSIKADDSSNSADRADKQQGGSSGVVAAVVICVLLLLLVVALLYFLNKKDKLPCGKKDKKAVSTGEVNSDIVVEMKTEKANEEAGLLNKRPAPEQ